MDALQGPTLTNEEINAWPITYKRHTLAPLPGLSSTLGALMTDSGEAPHYPDMCSHLGGLLKVGDGVTCLFCDSFPAIYNPQFFEKEENN